MINNRQAGRRRGRNNNGPRQNGGGGNRGNGGDSGNRIDNRARGNAVQLLEKYRNMARDAQLAGDRVNMEYYLQFADHYFRVLADNRARQEESQGGQGQSPQRVRRFEEGDQDDDFTDDGDGFGDPMDDFRRDEPRREDSSRDNGNRENGNRDNGNRDQGYREQGARDGGRDQAPRDRDQGNRDQGYRDQGARDQAPREQGNRDQPRRDRGEGRENRPPRRERAPVAQEFEPTAQEAETPVPVAHQAAPLQPAPHQPPITEAANDGADTAVEDVRPRRGRKPRSQVAAPDAAEPGLDMSILPPAIGRVTDGEEAAEPAPRRPRRPRSTPAQAAE